MTRRIAASMFAVVLTAGLPTVSRAQWAADTYEVDAVTQAIGNYTYRPGGGTTGGYVWAASHSSLTSEISVRYQRTWTGHVGDPGITITASTQVTGPQDLVADGSGCTAEPTVGTYNRSGTYSSSFTFSSWPADSSPGPVTHKITLHAYAYPIQSGHSSSADAEGWMD